MVGLSETWKREEEPISELINIEGYKVISNVKERDIRGVKPALIINEEKYHIKQLCPDTITVPVGVEAVWVSIRSKHTHPKHEVNRIIVCSYYYSKKVTKSAESLYDHFAESYNLLESKFGKKTQYIFLGDSNRLNL